MKKLKENVDKLVISEIEEIYENVTDINTSVTYGMFIINFTISGTGTSFEEVQGDMDNIADAYGLSVTDFSCFCDEGQDIDCDHYLCTGQPVEFCVSFEPKMQKFNEHHTIQIPHREYCSPYSALRQIAGGIYNL